MRDDMNRLFQLNQMCGSIADGVILNTTAIGSSNHESRSHSSSHTLNNQALSKQTINRQVLSNLLLNNQARNSSHQVVLEEVKEEELTCSSACTITHVHTKFLVACLLFSVVVRLSRRLLPKWAGFINFVPYPRSGIEARKQHRLNIFAPAAMQVSQLYFFK